MTWTEIGAELGLSSTDGVNKYVKQAIAKGELVRLGHGRYVAGPNLEIDDMADKALETTPEPVSTPASEVKRLDAMQTDLRKVEDWVVDLEIQVRKMAQTVAGVQEWITTQEAARSKAVEPRVESKLDHNERLLAIIEAQQRIIEGLLGGARIAS